MPFKFNKMLAKEPKNLFVFGALRSSTVVRSFSMKQNTYEKSKVPLLECRNLQAY